jgi:hypothetical protein
MLASLILSPGEIIQEREMPETRLREKLDNIRKNPVGSKDFLICDAKDNDMGGGVPAPGPRRGLDGTVAGLKTRGDYLDQVRAILKQDIVDLMLLSVSNLEILVKEGAFAQSRVGAAVRANDTSDIWGPRGGRYRETPSLPFRTAHIPHILYGREGVAKGTAPTLTDLGLYSVTFVNDAAADRQAMQTYRDFRIEAEAWGLRHFLEVFNPNVGADRLSREEVGAFVNDSIIHTLAGVPQIARPDFLKIPFNGPRAVGELASYDPSLIIGILGGGAGTTRDTFELVAQSKRYGARLVLFGRKINLAENPLELLKLMRMVADDQIQPAEAVRVYHDALGKSGAAPIREVKDDLEITEEVLR